MARNTKAEVEEPSFARICSHCDCNRVITFLAPHEQACSVCGDVQFGLWYEGKCRHGWYLKFVNNSYYLSRSTQHG